MDESWWVAVIRAWRPESGEARVIIRMVNSTESGSEECQFACVDDAVDQFRTWLEALHRQTEW